MRVHVLGVVGVGALWVCMAHSQVVTGVQVTTGPNGTTTQTTTAAGPAATSAQAAATSAQIAAANAEVPGSGIAPTTAAGTGAGSEEGALLVAPETRLAAQYLINKVLSGHDKVLVFVGGAAVPDVSPWLYFQNEAARLGTNIHAHRTDLERYLTQPIPPVKADFAPALVLVLAPKLLSYGYTSYSASGANLIPDDYMLDVALLKYAKGWRLYAQQIGQTMPQDVSDTLNGLDKESIAASSDVVVAQRELALLANANPGKPETTAVAQLIATLTADVANVTGDLTNYTAFLASLNSATSASSWSNVLQAYAFSQALDSKSGGGVAFIKIHSTALGVLTKSNLWTNLGIKAPMYTSVGMVVSYVFYEKGTSASTGGGGNTLVKQPVPIVPSKAGIFEVRTPYRKAQSVTKALEEDSAGHCTVDGPDDKYANAKKYCPSVYVDPPLPTPDPPQPTQSPKA